MKSGCLIAIGAVLALGLVPGRSQAQDAELQDTAPGKVVRLQLTIERYQGDRKVGSSPYTILTATNSDWARLRMGIETPVPVTTFKPADGKGAPATSFQYKTVGTNFDAFVKEKGDAYLVSMKVEDSTVNPPKAEPSGGPNATVTADAPLFRTFNATLNVLMRDGQTYQAVVGTDPVTGEVVKVEIGLKILK